MAGDSTGLVDVHAHFMTDRYIEVAKATGHPGPEGMPEEFWPAWSAASHLDLMDEVGISTSYLSLSSPGVDLGDDETNRSLAREINDFAADVVREHPGRFRQFASLPLSDIDASLAEIAYATDDLGAAGFVVMSHHRGRRLGDRAFEPVLAELDHRHAVAFLHPTSPPAPITPGSAYPEPIIEFLFETARTVLDFVISGAAERHPGIRLIVPHLGGVLPLLTERVDLFRTMILGEAAHATPDALGRFSYDLAGTPSAAQLSALATIAEPDQWLYGSDYPWAPHKQVARTLGRLDNTVGELVDDWRSQTSRNAHLLIDPTQNAGRR